MVKRVSLIEKQPILCAGVAIIWSFQPARSLTMARSLREFQGKGVVIGCSASHAFCKKEFHKDTNSFYTIDFNRENNPDFVFDITHQLPDDFLLKFKLTFLECLDYSAYNNKLISGTNTGGAKGFDNIWQMTAEDGFILIQGCPRQKEFREQIARRQLHYLELDAEHECILIPKNQTLTFDQVMDNINQLPQPFKFAIEKSKTYKGSQPNTEVKLLQTLYDTLPTFLEDSNSRSANAGKRIETFKKIYLALYHAQSSTFKRKNKLLSVANLTSKDIRDYVMKHPNSRSALAWSLAKEHIELDTPLPLLNKNLFKKIHGYALRHSSSFFGIFSRTRHFPGQNYDDFDRKIQEVDEKSRTGKIRAHLTA